jgi:hypothetical protein
MGRLAIIAFVIACSTRFAAQEDKPVPKDSVRVSIPGCARGYIFTTGRRTADQPGSIDIPENLHLRMNGSRKMMGEIKAHERSRIEITGIMKRDQLLPEGVALGGGLSVEPGSSTRAGGRSTSPTASQLHIDVEGWRLIAGGCSTR